MNYDSLDLDLGDEHIVGRHEKHNYALIKEGEANPFVSKDWLEKYNIKLLEYGPNYADLIPNMEALLDAVNVERASLYAQKNSPLPTDFD